MSFSLDNHPAEARLFQHSRRREGEGERVGLSGINWSDFWSDMSRFEPKKFTCPCVRKLKPGYKGVTTIDLSDSVLFLPIRSVSRDSMDVATNNDEQMHGINGEHDETVVVLNGDDDEHNGTVNSEDNEERIDIDGAQPESDTRHEQSVVNDASFDDQVGATMDSSMPR